MPGYKLREYVPALRYGAKLQLKELEGAGLLTFGSIFYVDSVTGSNTANDGRSPDQPYASIDTAVGSCTANKGDHIIVIPGHVETVTAAAGLDLDVAGITIIGLGEGDVRPTINFTTATTADMDFDATDITLQNILFTGGIDALAAPIDVNSDDCTLIDCEIRDVTGQVVKWFKVDGDRFHVYNLKGDLATDLASNEDTPDSVFELGTAAGTTGDIDDFQLEGFHIYGAQVKGLINSLTANTNISVNKGFYRTSASVSKFITTSGKESGIIGKTEADIIVQLGSATAVLNDCITNSGAYFVYTTGGIHLVRLSANRTAAYTGVAASTSGA